jgi:hypothetical protein
VSSTLMALPMPCASRFLCLLAVMACQKKSHEGERWCSASSATRNKHETDMISPAQADTVAKVEAKSRIWRIRGTILIAQELRRCQIGRQRGSLPDRLHR